MRDEPLCFAFSSAEIPMGGRKPAGSAAPNLQANRGVIRRIAAFGLERCPGRRI
jgi:hypothetical protein